MRITYIHQYFATPQSAGGIRSYLIARTLVNRGHKVNMLTSSAFVPSTWVINKGWNLIEHENINVHVLHLPYSNNTGFVRRLYIFVLFMMRTLFKSFSLKSDIIYATSTPLTVAIPAGICASFKRIPFVFEVRDVWPDIPIAMGYLNNKLMRMLAKRLEAWAYRKASHIIALSEGMAERIEGKGVESRKVSVVENFSDNELFESVNSLEYRPDLQTLKDFDGKILTYTGTFGHVNNLRYIVDLSAKLLGYKEDVRFALIGDGKEKKELLEYAGSKDVLGENLFFYDPVRKEQLSWILNNSDCAISTVLPIEELWDNSANKFFDALAAGLPMVINHGGWQADLINKESCGVVLHDQDITEAADQLMAFLSNESKLAIAKKKSKKLAKEKFETSLQTEKVCRTLEGGSI